MTAPVFSEREVSHILATRKVCGRCKGGRRVVVTRPCNLYACGTATFCIPCPECHGFGFLDPNPVRDFKTEACNG